MTQNDRSSGASGEEPAARSTAAALGRRGRPRKEKSLSVMMPMRVFPEEAAFCRERGGSAYVRELIRREMARLANESAESRTEEEASAPQRLCEASASAPLPAGLPSRAGRGGRATPFTLESYLPLKSRTAFVVRAAKSQLVDAGIAEGDILVVDSSIPPAAGRIVVARINGRFAVRRLVIGRDGALALRTEHAAEGRADYAVGPEDALEIAGVVTGLVRRVK